tara:strand:- start:400 stop:1062 length:663 start_codon:yes stop_codon:yes gene_type:complete
MKIVAIVPIKSKSKRLKNKNFRKINGKPLYRYLLDKLKFTKFDEIYVDSDSLEIEKYCRANRYKFVKRIPKLALDSANGNDLLNYHSKIIKADIYFQLFITAPLLKTKTINSCIKKLKNSKKHDSILTSKSIQTWFWFKGKPVNYNPKILPRSQDASPLVFETTGLYGIKRKILMKKKSRIGDRPYFYEVDDEEAIDLDNLKDLKYLEYHVKKNFISAKR